MSLFKILLNNFFRILAAALFAANAQAACETPPAGIRDVGGNSFYTDSHYSIVDEALKEKAKAAAKPFDDFLKNVSKNSDSYIENKDKSAASCGLQWLTRWAQDDAMLGKMLSTQAQHQRKWILAGLALSYIKIKPEATNEQRITIETWFKKLADASLDFANKSHLSNNHLYWIGLAVMATGVASNDNHYIDEARKIYDAALLDIQDDGTFPQELSRAGKALSYHNYALAPLVMMAELAKSKKENWYQHKNFRLDKVAQLVLKGIVDSSWFAEKTGVVQEIPRGGILGWVVFYQMRNENFNRLVTPILAQQPFYYTQLGGNLSLLAQQHFFDQL